LSRSAVGPGAARGDHRGPLFPTCPSRSDRSRAIPKSKSDTKNRGAVRVQYGALPYRFGAEGELELLLVTSRGRGRWIMPKGWPIKGLKPQEAAAREAF
jgi:8-oxo-dGTP pyrophosphatase MutT (NUDIX family)